MSASPARQPRVKATVISVWPAVSAAVDRRYPMRRTVRVCASSGTRNMNAPLSFVAVPIVVPVTMTWATGIGRWSDASTT